MSRVSSSTMNSTEGAPASKRRRGRQPRTSPLSSAVRAAAAQFALEVGAPRVIEPAGFRDFAGWLQRLSSNAAADAWARLLRAVLADCGGDLEALRRIQPEVVREIIANVVTIRQGESSKLVSTNARRQSSRPEQGLTLLKIFDNKINSADLRPVRYSSHHSHHSHHVSSSHHKHGSSHAASSSRSSSSSSPNSSASSRGPPPPMASPQHGGGSTSVKLPSMQELVDSLRRHGERPR